MKIKDIGEFGLIDRITKKPKDKDVLVGIGDDAAVFKTEKGLRVMTTDCLLKVIILKENGLPQNRLG